MTFIIVSKEHVLSDRVSYLDIDLPTDNSVSSVSLPFESKCKIRLVQDKGAKDHGYLIKAYAVVGHANNEDKFEKAFKLGIDLDILIDIDCIFDASIFLDSSKLLVFSGDSVTTVVDFEDGKPCALFTEHQSDKLLFFGTGANIVNSYYSQIRENGYNPTPLDMFVLLQSLSGNYGDEFDWYDRVSNTINTKIKLTKKQREKIIQKLQQYLVLKTQHELTVNICNKGD